jgi:hypothetical protein
MGEDISTSWARLARNSLAGTCLVGPFLPWAVLWSWLVAPEAASFMVSIWGTPITSGAMQFTSFIKLLRALFCLVDAHVCAPMPARSSLLCLVSLVNFLGCLLPAAPTGASVASPYWVYLTCCFLPSVLWCGWGLPEYPALFAQAGERAGKRYLVV